MSGAVFAGQLRRRVILLTPTSTIDSAGRQQRAYANGPQIWAHIKALAQSVRYDADRREGVVTHHITVRATANFDAGFRILFGQRVFEVLSFEICEGVPQFVRAYCQETQPWV